ESWRREEAAVAASERLETVDRLAKQAAERDVAAAHVRDARDAVLRIERMDQEVAEAEKKVAELAGSQDQAELALKNAQRDEVAAADDLNAAELAARSAGLGSESADLVARQSLQLRSAAAERAAQQAQQGIDSAAVAQRLVDAAIRAAADHLKQEAEAVRAREKRAKAAETEQVAEREARVCDLLERAWHARLAERQAASARADVEREAALQVEWTKASEKRTAAAEGRAAISVPPPVSLAAMRKLANELASARGALDVGLTMTVTPAAPVAIEVRKDGVAADRGVVAQPIKIEASAEVEVRIADLATVLVRGGRREAQVKVRSLEERWDREVRPHLAVAGVTELDALDGKAADAMDLESRVRAHDSDLESLRRQLAALAGAAEALRQASAHAAICHLALGDATLETLAGDLDALGSDPGGVLRTRRQQAAQDADAARTAGQEASTAQTLAEERERTSLASLKAAVAARDAALANLPSGLAAGAAVAQERLRASIAEQEKVEAELASLQSTIDARRQQLEEAVGRARAAAANARSEVDAARRAHTKAITDHASEERGLAERRKLRAAQDLSTAERTLREAAERHDALPVPERSVTSEEAAAARDELAGAKRALETIHRELHITQGALQQVGGAVARDRLRDATEAFELAERQEIETEADYEAWKLLLEQMKEADAAQASNLGQALAPAIADRFQALTQQRYQSIQLTAQLETDGIVIAGEVQPPKRISVGTREQLSTLYRLCLGEFLRTTIVLDDQLVQSDPDRMDWFRALLVEKARCFQIVVFTCRPTDYLPATAMVADGGPAHLDSDEGFVRAIDLNRAVHRCS
ncbi:MAG TPA: hypothetical protein VJA16_04335, partial [Thermoanaerobaculia bacterium]